MRFKVTKKELYRQCGISHGSEYYEYKDEIVLEGEPIRLCDCGHCNDIFHGKSDKNTRFNISDIEKLKKIEELEKHNHNLGDPRNDDCNYTNKINELIKAYNASNS